MKGDWPSFSVLGCINRPGPGLSFEIVPTLSRPSMRVTCACCRRIMSYRCPSCVAGDCPGACRSPEGGVLIPVEIAAELLGET